MSRTAEYEAAWPSQLKIEKETLEKEIATLRKQRKDEGRFLDVDKEEKRLAELKEAHIAASAAHKKTLKDAADKSSKQVAELLADAKNKAAILEDEANQRLAKAQTAEQGLAKREVAIVAKENALATEANDLAVRATKLVELGVQFNQHVDRMASEILAAKLR
jgi:hypothetical protein